MSCLFGDATDSELELDYILLIRDLFDFAVDVLRADQVIDELDEALRSSAQAAAREKARLEALHGRLAEAIGPELAGSTGAASRCAEAMGRACRLTVDEEIARLETEIDRERTLADKARRRQRQACVKALETLMLVPHELPEATHEVEMSLAGELGYQATLRSRTEYGLETTLALAIYDGNLFGGSPVRVGPLASGLELHLPEQRGWISKKVKRVKHKLAKYFVTRARVSSSRITISVRTEATLEGEGYDLLLDADWEQPRVLVVSPGGADGGLMDAHELDGADALRVQELFTAIAAAIEPTRTHPTSLLEAVFEGTRLADHTDPTALVDRLFEVMGPTVREIAEHSTQADELVLKRSMGGDRREEIYVSRSDLAARLEVLSPEQRARFAPLGFGVPAAAVAARRTVRVSPAARVTQRASRVPPPAPRDKQRAESEPAHH